MVTGVGVGTLRRLRDSVYRAYEALSGGDTDAALWILAGVHDDLADLADAVNPYAVERAIMLALDPETCRRILLGMPVRAEQIDRVQERLYGSAEAA